MKKIILLLLSLVLFLSFVACSSKNEDIIANDNIEDNKDIDDKDTEDMDSEDKDTEDKDAEDKDAEDQDTEDKDTEDKEGSNVFEGSLESILEKIYETADIDDSFRAYTKDGLMTTEITSENVAYYFGTEGIEFESGIASEPMMTSSAYSLTLIRVKEGADIEKLKTDIKENVNPMKWICVGVEPENIFVDSYEDVVVLIMSDEQGTALYEGFKELTK